MVKKFLVFLLCGPILPWNFVVIAIDALYNNILNKVKIHLVEKESGMAHQWKSCRALKYFLLPWKSERWLRKRMSM